MLLDDMLRAVKDKHDKKPITPEAYHRWRRDGVTRRLMEEIESEMIKALSDDIHGGVEQVAMKTAENRGRRDSIENVIAWKPQELMQEEDKPESTSDWS